MIHTYQKYDPRISPVQLRPRRCGLVGLRAHADVRQYARTDRRGACPGDAVWIPSQIAGLGPSLERCGKCCCAEGEDSLHLRDAPRAERSRRTLPGRRARAAPPKQLEGRRSALPATSNCARSSNCGISPAASAANSPTICCAWPSGWSDKYQIDEMAGKYEFTGHERLTIPRALEVKEELEKIDELLKQLEEAARTAQIGVIDMEQLSNSPTRATSNNSMPCTSRFKTICASWPSSKGWKKRGAGFKLTPKAYRLFQGKLLRAHFQRAGTLAHWPASGTDRRRRCRRVAEHQAVRVRRFGRADGYPGHAYQRHGAAAAQRCRSVSGPRTSRSIARAIRPSVPRWC